MELECVTPEDLIPKRIKTEGLPALRHQGLAVTLGKKIERSILIRGCKTDPEEDQDDRINKPGQTRGWMRFFIWCIPPITRKSIGCFCCIRLWQQ